MHIKSFILAAASIVSMGSLSLAGPFETANAYLGGKYGVPDFTFTKSEFGRTNIGQLIHLGAELVVERIAGATVVYNPATNEVLVWGTIAATSGTAAKQYASGSGCFGTYGTVVSFGTQSVCVPGSSIGSEGSPERTVLLSTTPGTPRSCSFDAGKDGIDVHSC